MPQTTTTHPCGQPGCDRTFATAQAAGKHRSAMHGIAGATRAPKPPRRPMPYLKATTTGARPKPLPARDLEPQDDYDPWALLIGHTTHDGPTTSAVVLSTKTDAHQVANLLTALGHTPYVFRVADAAQTA